MPALARRPEAGPLPGEQVWDAPHPVAAASAQQELAPQAPRAPPGQEGPKPLLPGRLGPHLAPGQGIAAAPDHGGGGGRGAQVGRATLGFPAAALGLRGLSDPPMGGPGAPPHCHPAPAWAPALGTQLGPERMDVACERIHPGRYTGWPGGQARSVPRGALQRVPGRVERQPGRGRTAHSPPQVPAVNGTGHGQGPAVECVAGAGIHLLTLQGKMRGRGPGTLRLA
jgi:hypothetical protein